MSEYNNIYIINLKSKIDEEIRVNKLDLSDVNLNNSFDIVLAFSRTKKAVNDYINNHNELNKDLIYGYKLVFDILLSYENKIMEIIMRDLKQ